MTRLQLLAVTPHVLCVRRPWYLSNSYIVHDDRGVVLVDAGMEAGGDDMLAGLRHLGRSPCDVAAILLTHWHNDHSSGAEALRRMSNAVVYYHADEHPHFSRTAVHGWRMRLADALPESGPPAALKAMLGQSPPRAIAAACHVTDGQVIEERFRVVATPGHSSGHLSYLYEPERVLFTGDALAVCGGRLWFMSRFLTEDRERARASMLTCAEVDTNIVCPGHRRPLTTGVAEHRRSLRRYLQSGRRWPWLS
jgi:glyoxylase-like metal-dependent hydrolase (beta-lactamase superfamily II)